MRKEMKKFVPVLASILFALIMVSCNNEPKQIEIPNTQTTAADSQPEKLELVAENKSEVNMKVGGMTCAMGCAKFIEDKVAKLSGVILSQVNFQEGTAHFEFDKTALSSEEIEDFINEIHDGQYTAEIMVGDETEEAEEEEEADDSDAEDSEESMVSVVENVSISFPELFTYFLRHLR